MIPVMLDPASVKVAVCGEGVLTMRRIAWLQDCGARPLVFAPMASAELANLAGDDLVTRLPDASDFASLRAIWIADFANDVAAPLAHLARDHHLLVNVEDVLDFCDFHTPAIIHRGRLTLAIGTGGASPAIASIVRQRLETAFPAAWSDLVEEIVASRLILKAKGARFADLVADARERVTSAGL